MLSTLFLLFALLAAPQADAVVIQILHTNDLHAALNTAGEPKPGDPEYGGWVQVKAVLDYWTQRGKELGIDETIRLDAGDFLEGTIQYFPQNGINVLRTYQQMDWDASALGNHDWLMGARGLDQLLSQRPFTSPLLSANIKIHPRLKALSKQLSPYTIVEKAGVKIGVFGLSTTEAFYKWIPKIRSRCCDFKIRNYEDYYGVERDAEGNRILVPGIANKTIAELRPKVDALVALTHIGFDRDLDLVYDSRGLDLVVGGHSHSALETLTVEVDRDGHEVPIVQTGYNGRTIGRVTMEILPGQRPRVLTTELIPVPHRLSPETPADAEVAQSVAIANQAVVSLYGAERLNEVIGQSEVRLVPGKYGPTAFSKFAVDAIQKSVDADVGIDIGLFHANTPLPGGEVTRRKLMEMYPRKFESDQNQGLYVYHARTPGLILALALKFAVKYGLYASFSGVGYKPIKLTDAEYQRALKKEKSGDKEFLTRYRAKEITVNGQKICLTCVYEIAAPESVVRGAYGISPLTRLILWSGRRSSVTIWQALEKHLRDIKVIKPLEGNEIFSSRRYANFYQRTFGGQLDPEQLRPSELGTPPTSFLDQEMGHGEQSPHSLLEAFQRELIRVKKANPLLNEKTDADALGID